MQKSNERLAARSRDFVRQGKTPLPIVQQRNLCRHFLFNPDRLTNRDLSTVILVLLDLFKGLVNARGRYYYWARKVLPKAFLFFSLTLSQRFLFFFSFFK